MKTILRVTFLFALVAIANSLFAAGNLKLNIFPVDAEKAVVAISTLTDSDFNITIADEKGQIIFYQEGLNTGEYYRKVYDFSDLANGNYTLTVVSDETTSERQFEKTYDVISVGEERTTLEPFFGYEDGILRCSYLNFESESVTLRFFENNELIFSKKLGRDFNIQQALNLSKLDKGNYAALLSAGGKEFSYFVDIE